MLGDLDYKLCETALMELFATHTYPPQISEIREKCAEYTVPHLKDQGEAWGEVQKAISQYGYYRQEEALESLTPIVREAVKRLGFRGKYVLMRTRMLSEHTSSRYIQA